MPGHTSRGMQVQKATHEHKRVGAVVVLEWASELVKILVPSTGEQFWVKLADLSPLIGSADGRAH
jgi:hypothetical protein